MKINFKTAQKKIATLWFIMSGLIFILMIMMSFNKLQGHLSFAWGWLFPNILPSLTLILTIFLLNIQQGETDNVKMIDRFYFRLVFFLSLFYLLILLLILLSAGFGTSIIKVIEDSNFYLGPIQGLIGASLGLLFFKKES